jgi:hypothetical protein
LEELLARKPGAPNTNNQGAAGEEQGWPAELLPPHLESFAASPGGSPAKGTSSSPTVAEALARFGSLRPGALPAASGVNAGSPDSQLPLFKMLQRQQWADSGNGDFALLAGHDAAADEPETELGRQPSRPHAGSCSSNRANGAGKPVPYASPTRVQGDPWAAAAAAAGSDYYVYESASEDDDDDGLYDHQQQYQQQGDLGPAAAAAGSYAGRAARPKRQRSAYPEEAAAAAISATQAGAVGLVNQPGAVLDFSGGVQVGCKCEHVDNMYEQVPFTSIYAFIALVRGILLKVSLQMQHCKSLSRLHLVYN